MINNPYAAYQKFAQKPLNNQKVRKDYSENKSQMIDSVKINEITQTKVITNTAIQSDQYLRTSIMTATPEELTLMLYDGAIKFMRQAQIFIEDKKIQKANEALIRTQDIFAELMGSLDMGYEISHKLYDLYDFIKTSLTTANIKKDISLIEEMVSLTKDLRSTWVEAMKISKQESK